MKTKLSCGSRIGVIGLGYVGLPLAVEFGKSRAVLGFDINQARIVELQTGYDRTHECSPELLATAEYLRFSADESELDTCLVFIVTVPTPVDATNRPDLSSLITASKIVGRHLPVGGVVIYESTVFPGATEEVCVPVLEQTSGLKFNADFFIGYSPERINPGEKARPLTTIIKVTSGSTPEAADFVDDLYASIIVAGTHRAASIRVAEAAKVIENTQRDLNIALINELAIIFNRLGIDTEAVLKAAGTKWNFLRFQPGLVGGHCIGVDPYYLTHKAEMIGYHPQIILAGRRLNNGMGSYIAGQMVKALLRRRIHIEGARILIMGLSFKENCPDLRNTRVVDVISELQDYGTAVDVYDPWVDVTEAEREYGITPISQPDTCFYDGIILAVAHQAFADMGQDEIRKFGRREHVLYDLKYVFSADKSDLRL